MATTTTSNTNTFNDIKIKPMRGRPLKSKATGDSNIKHAYKGFNRVKKRKVETSLPDLLFENIPNYKGELDNREVSLEEYVVWYFGSEKAKDFIKPMERKLQKGLRINLLRKEEILKYLRPTENISEFKENNSASKYADLFKKIPADLFVGVPKISKYFSKDFLLEMFKYAEANCKEPPHSLIHKLKRLQLNIEGVKCRFIKEIPEIEIIARSDFIIIENETCYKEYLNDFRPLYREVLSIKNRIIKLNSDNDFSRLLISKTNNLLKILKNSVYYREVFLKEYHLSVSSMGMKLDVGRDYESKIVLSLLREGVDPSRIYFNKEKKPGSLKQSVDPESMIIHTLREKLIRKGKYSNEGEVKFSEIYENEVREMQEAAFVKAQGTAYASETNPSVVFNNWEDKFNSIDFRTQRQFESQFPIQEPINYPNKNFSHHLDHNSNSPVYHQNLPFNQKEESFHRNNFPTNQNSNMFPQNRPSNQQMNQPSNMYNPNTYNATLYSRPNQPSNMYPNNSYQNNSYQNISHQGNLYPNNPHQNNNYVPILNYSHNTQPTIRPYDTPHTQYTRPPPQHTRPPPQYTRPPPQHTRAPQHTNRSIPRTQNNTNLSLIITRIYQLMLATSPPTITTEKNIVDILNDSKHIIQNFLNKLNSVNLQYAGPNELIQICNEFGFEVNGEPKDVFAKINKTKSLIMRLLGIYGSELSN